MGGPAQIPATMKAMQLGRPRAAGERPLSLVVLPVPQPGPREVLLRVRACGVCHTDLHTVEGELAPHKSPVVPGHQIVGEVVAFGPGAASVPAAGDPSAAPFRLGERAGVPWLHWADGTCVYCRAGQENLCDHARFTGYDVDGGYAEYAVAPAAFAYRLPDMDDLAVAPLLCAGNIGYRCLRLSGVLEGARAADPAGEAELGVSGEPAAAAEPARYPDWPQDEPSTALDLRAAEGIAPRRLGLYGFGAAAHIGLQVARHLGWDVYVFTRGAEHRRLALELGAVWAGRARAGGASGGEAAGNPPPALDAAIIFAPAGELVIDALKAVRKGGVVTLGGIYSSPIPPIDYPLIYHERVLRSVANSTRRDARELLALASAVPVRTEVQVFALEEANEVLVALKDGHVRGASSYEASGVAGRLALAAGLLRLGRRLAEGGRRGGRRRRRLGWCRALERHGAFCVLLRTGRRCRLPGCGLRRRLVRAAVPFVERRPREGVAAREAGRRHAAACRHARDRRVTAVNRARGRAPAEAGHDRGDDEYRRQREQHGCHRAARKAVAHDLDLTEPASEERRDPHVAHAVAGAVHEAGMVRDDPDDGADGAQNDDRRRDDHAPSTWCLHLLRTSWDFRNLQRATGRCEPAEMEL
jgi:alcohol dehydrogenase, propanol-preferring